jgi:hypothetical protein
LEDFLGLDSFVFFSASAFGSSFSEAGGSVMVGSGTGSTTTAMGSSVVIANLRVRIGNWIIMERVFRVGFGIFV